MTESQRVDLIKADIATAARAFAKLGYVHAFGHVSVRGETTVFITPTTPPLARQTAPDILEVDFDGRVVLGDAIARPIEVFLHLAIYRARADVGAICRTHSPSTETWWDNPPPVQHGFGGLADKLASWDDSDLVHTPDRGERAAARLGDGDGLFLRGNGSLTVGRDVAEAAARAWSLEQRCALALRGGADRSVFDLSELKNRQVWYPAEAARLWLWLSQLTG
jgi:ribulose-5-phosphate 4-epimerase/fuculose-1-phosphate aldolase